MARLEVRDSDLTRLPSDGSLNRTATPHPNLTFAAPYLTTPHLLLLQSYISTFRANMDAISDGPLGVVFSHVDRNLQLQSAALVCQRWRRLLQLLTSLVSSLVVSELVDPSPSPSPTPAGPIRLAEGALRCMGDWFRHLVALDLSGCTVSSPAALTAATGSLAGLTTLSLSGNTEVVTNSTLSMITARCTRLTSLDLTHCRQVTSGLAALASLNHLQRLCLAYCKGVTGDDDCLGAVVGGGAKSLTSLDLTHCRGLTKQGIRNLAAHLTIRASSSTTAAPLAHLCLAYVHAVQDTGLGAIVESCGKELLSLDVTQVPSNITPSRLCGGLCACVCARDDTQICRG